MLLDFGNQWIYSPIEFCCLFSQVLMVGIKDLLEGWRSNNGGERVSFGSIFLEQNDSVEKITIVGRA